jgi:IclR family KDG regulon transcriptional repressor
MVAVLNKYKYQVHSLERGLDLIEILAQQSSERSLTDISKLSGFNLTTTYRIIKALQARGYVKRDPLNSEYTLGLKLFELGESAIRNIDLRKEALPILKGLADRTGESAYLMILDKDEALCLERIDGYHDIKILLVQRGGRAPLHMGAAPRVLLAHLPEKEIDRIIKEKGLPAKTKYTITNPKSLKEDLRKIREQGFAVSIEDVTKYAVAVGSPIRNWNGEIIAAISISGIITHFQGKQLSEKIRIIKSAAEELSNKLYVPKKNGSNTRFRKNSGYLKWRERG